MKRGIIGAIIGDVVGSRFEWSNNRSIEFEFLTEVNKFTDDTVCTCAVADWLVNDDNLAEELRTWAKKYPKAGYGGKFRDWVFDKEILPAYNSFGNGSAMRVSPVGFYATTFGEALELAKKSAEVTHNHHEGIKGAQAVACAIFLARAGRSKEEIKKELEYWFNYDLSRKIDGIRPVYKFDASCQGSVPEAIIAFLESEDYESAIRLAISIGGDSDTIACITGGIAGAYYGVPDDIVESVMKYLKDDVKYSIKVFDCICESRCISGELEMCSFGPDDIDEEEWFNDDIMPQDELEELLKDIEDYEEGRK